MNALNHYLIFAIIVAGITNYLLKLFPIVFRSKIGEHDNFFTKFLDYTSCCIIGQIIYSVAYHNASIYDILGLNHALLILNSLFIVLAFIVCMFTGSIMKAVAFTLIPYAIIAAFCLPH